MKNTFGMRLLSFLLVAVMVLTMVPTFAIPRADGAEAYYDGVASQISALMLPKGELKANLSGDITGLWLIKSVVAKVADSSGSLLNPDRHRGWNAKGEVVSSNYDHCGFETTAVTATSNTLQITDKKYYITVKGTTNGCSFRLMNGKYMFAATGNGAVYANLFADSLEYPDFKLVARSNSSHSVQLNGNNVYLFSNGHSFRARKKDHLDFSTSTYYHFHFYKVSQELLNLYETLQGALPYVDNADGRYYDAYHQAFIDRVKGAISRYTSMQAQGKGTVTADEKLSIEEDISQIALLIDKLSASGSQRTYIDIPIEVLDFRGDGFLFEDVSCFGTPYSLSKDSPSAGGLSRPGTKENGTTSASDDFRIIGLVEGELYDGNVVYKEEVVDYIAAALKNKVKLRSTSGKMNKAFRAMVDSNPDLGSFDETIGKAKPAVNGGVLFWEQVETCYDLAYYMLSSVWREVPRSDILGQDTLYNSSTSVDYNYNIPVPELNHLRLYYIDNPESGKNEYAFNSYFDSEYEDGYIYNTSTNNHGVDPTFQALNGLGFESTDLFGPATEGRGNTKENYGFSVHAYGGFVYSESGDLYFTFSGDDDVYFYINNTRVCDIGGVHGRTKKSVNLNDIAADLNLKEGQICTFDMFYAERRTSGINMELYTNIQLMDMDVITGKQQHDATTGKKLVDGAAVNIGTETDYSFSIRNRRLFPVNNVSFDDPAIGTTLSPDGITLNSKTKLTDIVLTYRSYDRNKDALYDGEVTNVANVATMKALLTNFTPADNSNPMTDIALTYQFRSGDSLADLQEILALGIPAGCEFTIYGFNRTVNAGMFSNTMTSSCTPLVVQYDENQVPYFVQEAPIPGTASCRIYGIDMGTVSVADPRAYVIDYGKALEIPVDATKSAITCDSGMYTTFVGIAFNGENGAVKTEAPTTMLGANGLSSARGMYGLFTLSGNVLTYKPDSFLEGVESCYSVFRLSASSNNTGIAYIYVEIQVIPANRMYYEAEDFTNELSYMQKATDKTTAAVSKTELWTVSGTERTVYQHLDPSGDQNIVIPDYSKATNVLFFGFDNTTADATRYALPQYKGTNFDRSTWSGGASAFVASGNTTITSGNLKIVPKTNVPQSVYPDSDGKAGNGAVALHPDCSDNGNKFGNKNEKALNYDPSEAEVFQIRFKMKNLDTKVDANGNKARPYFGLHIWAEAKSGHLGYKVDDAGRCIEDFTYDPAILNLDEYVVWTVPLAREFSNVKTIWGVRAYFGSTFGSLQGKAGYLMVDYIYIGPADIAPYREAYGYDPSYENVEELSGGASLYTEGNGVSTPAVPYPANYTQTKFSFTGTGFDLISRTGPDQATIRVEIFDKEGCSQDDLVTFATVNLKGEIDKYQIPVYSKEGLDYGTYWVKIGVNDKVNYPMLPQLSRGNQFYFDGLIIYDPVEATGQALNAYKADGEAYPYATEVRDILLDATEFKELSNLGYGSVDGAVYLDYESVPKVTVPVLDEDGNPTGATENITDPDVTGISNHITTNILTYEKVGPKNEVYLSPKHAIAFKLAIYSQELPARIDVGCKSIMDPGGILCIETAKGENMATGVFSRPLDSSTVQYFSLPLNNNVFTEEKIDGKPCYTTYIVIRNTAANNAATKNAILSITDIKFAYTEEPTPKTESSGSGSSSDGGSSGTGIQSVGIGTSKRNGNGDLELPTDAFVPVGFVVDSNIETVIRSVLLEYTYDEETELEEDDFETKPADLAFAGASVALQSDLTIYYKVKESYFTEMGYTDPYVMVVDGGVEVILRDYTVQDGLYSFAYRNIAPHRIGDNITATLYATYEGDVYASEVKEYSVADYCYNMLSKTAAMEGYETFSTLLVDLLLYGGKTQQYMSYRLDSLCTARLTEEQLACASELSREPVSVRNPAYEVVENATVQWRGAGLNLRESVAVRFLFTAENYEGLEARITMAGKTYVVEEKDFDYRTEGAYIHFRSLNAAQMSEPICVAVYRDDVQVSNTICYSIESYAASKQSDTTVPYLGELVERMMCYGDSAKAYVGK